MDKFDGVVLEGADFGVKMFFGEINFEIWYIISLGSLTVVDLISITQV